MFLCYAFIFCLVAWTIYQGIRLWQDWSAYRMEENEEPSEEDLLEYADDLRADGWEVTEFEDGVGLQAFKRSPNIAGPQGEVHLTVVPKPERYKKLERELLPTLPAIAHHKKSHD